MHSSGTDGLSKGSCSAPSTNSSTSLPLMLQPLGCWSIDVSSVSTLTTRLSTVPFPWGPCWRRIQHRRKLHKASWTGQINRGICSSILARGSSPQLPSVYHLGREICIKYQSNSCTFPNCRRAHICRHSKQEHPASECHPAGPVTPQPR